MNHELRSDLRPLRLAALLALTLGVGAYATPAFAQDGNMGGQDDDHGEMHEDEHGDDHGDMHEDEGDEGHDDDHGDAHEGFEHGMEEANAGFRQLRQIGFDAANAEKLMDAVQMVQDGLMDSKENVAKLEMTEKAKSEYGDDVDKFRRDLRKGLIEAMNAALQIENALADGDMDAAQTAFQALGQAQREGHQKFRSGPGGGQGGPGMRNRQGGGRQGGPGNGPGNRQGGGQGRGQGGGQGGGRGGN